MAMTLTFIKISLKYKILKAVSKTNEITTIDKNLKNRLHIVLKNISQIVILTKFIL